MDLLKQELKNGKTKFEAERLLYQKGVIAQHTFFAKESEWIAQQQGLADLKKTYVNYKIAAANYLQQKNETAQQLAQQKQTLMTAIATSMNSIENDKNNWQQSYTFTAPIDGKLSYLSHLAENQFVSSPTPLLAIVPNNQHYVGHLTIPAQGMGKVEKGQKVRIQLSNYPHQEFGQLVGKITDISLMSTTINEGQQAYLISISLPQSLTTTYQKQLKFTPEMTGTAQIVTKDLRLIERVFNSFRKVLEG